MIASISGTLMQPQHISFQNSSVASRKVSQGEEASETPAERRAELKQSKAPTNSSAAINASHSSSLGRTIDIQA